MRYIPVICALSRGDIHRRAGDGDIHVTAFRGNGKEISYYASEEGAGDWANLVDTEKFSLTKAEGGEYYIITQK